ncbi:hypothetical protein QOT17_014004 [Balamuthia mandrillaris]
MNYCWCLCSFFALVCLLGATGSSGQQWQPWEGWEEKAEHPLDVAVLTDLNSTEKPYWADYREAGGPYWASSSFFLTVFLNQLPTVDLSDIYPPEHLNELLPQFLSDGGVVVWTGNLYNLNSTLSLNIKDIVGGGGPARRQLTEEVFEKTEAAQGTPFANGPAFLENWDIDQVTSMDDDGWPEDAICIYAAEEEGTNVCAVFFMPFGEGTVVYLGWSYFAYDWPAPFLRREPMVNEVEERDFATEQWRDVFLLAVEGFVEVEQPSSSSSGAQDGDGESSSESEDSSSRRVIPFAF